MRFRQTICEKTCFERKQFQSQVAKMTAIYANIRKKSLLVSQAMVEIQFVRLSSFT